MQVTEKPSEAAGGRVGLATQRGEAQRQKPHRRDVQGLRIDAGGIMESRVEKYRRLVYIKELRLFRWLCCNVICNSRYYGNEAEFHADPEAAVAWVKKEFDEAFPDYELGGETSGR